MNTSSVCNTLTLYVSGENTVNGDHSDAHHSTFSQSSKEVCCSYSFIKYIVLELRTKPMINDIFLIILKRVRLEKNFVICILVTSKEKERCNKKLEDSKCV